MDVLCVSDTGALVGTRIVLTVLYICYRPSIGRLLLPHGWLSRGGGGGLDTSVFGEEVPNLSCMFRLPV